MTAYSFKQRFIAPILAGTKTQTIRADRRRHARPGGQLQLYTGMRTKQCRLIALATCAAVGKIIISFVGPGNVKIELPGEAGPIRSGMYGPRWGAVHDLDTFSRRDGFTNWDDMRAFWRAERGDVSEWDGVIICWHPLTSS